MPKVLVEMEKIRGMYYGLGQFCYHLGINLIKNNHYPLDLFYYLPEEKQNIFEGFDNTHVLKNYHKRFNWFLPDADIWHATHQDSPFVPSGKKTKYILTIHDLNFLVEKKNEEKKKKLLNELQKKVDRADALVFISEYSKKVAEGNLKIIDKPEYVIYNGVALKKNIVPKKPEFIPKGKFIFSIGTVIPKKNFHVLIDFMKEIRGYNLILAGSLHNKYASKMIERINSEGLAAKFILPGKVTEEEKFWLYSNCDAFIFPSLAEGFGLPVVEAMRFGKPLFLSNKTSLPEIGGDLPYYFGNFDSGYMREIFDKGMVDFKNNPSKSESLITRSKRFSWIDAANAYLDLYWSLLKK